VRCEFFPFFFPQRSIEMGDRTMVESVAHYDNMDVAQVGELTPSHSYSGG
jgi:hypothetical protein